MAIPNEKIIKEMLNEHNNCKKKLKKLQGGIDDTGLGIDIDGIYDALYEAERQLNTCLEKMTIDATLISDCHYATVKRADSAAGHYYRCTVCNEPCDVEEKSNEYSANSQIR